MAATLQSIYERLHGAGTYHPFSADTFQDWATEAGDVLTISRGNDEYVVPVHTTQMDWHGVPQMTMNTTGNRERESIEKAAQRKSSRGGYSYRVSQELYYEFTSEDGMLHSSIAMSSSELRTEFHNANSTMYSVISQTASQIRTEVANTESSLRSTITQTAGEIRSEVSAANSTMYSAISQTASEIRSEVANATSGMSSLISQTANEIRSEVNAANSTIYSSISQTASQIRSEVANVESGMASMISQTANEIRSEVNAANSMIYSSITQTASAIRSEVANVQSGMSSLISQTANEIRSEVNAANSTIYSSIRQTASQIQSEVANTTSGLRSLITQTANEVRSEVSASNSTIYSTITQTASQIRGEVISTNSNLRSVINQTASQILLQVGSKAQVFHQHSDPALTEEVKNKDIWIKDAGVQTHGKAANFTHGQLGEFKLAEFYGSEIYVRENGTWVRVGGDQLSELNYAQIKEEQDRISIITDGMSGDYAEFIVEIGRIRSRVENTEAGLQSTIEQTASMIRSAVWTANSEMYSEILQTQSMVRSEVGSSESRLRTTITQTASGLNVLISHKRTQYIQQNDPSVDNVMYDGDLWIIDNSIYSHAAMAAKTHASLGAYSLLDFYGKNVKVWKGGTWLPFIDERAQHFDETRIDANEKGIYLLKGDLSEQYSQFMVEKEAIRGIVEDKTNKLGSEILQTATQIRTSVWAANSQIYSTITQTASQIRSEVGNSISGLRSQITQQADRISLVVEGTGSNAHIKPAAIVESINSRTGTSRILLSANQIDINGIVTALNGKLVTVQSLAAESISGAKFTLETNNGQFVVAEAGADWKRGGNTFPMEYTVVDAEVDGNTLILYHMDGTETTFSKATTLTPSWSGSTLTVAAKQTNGGATETVASKTLGFGGLVSSHDIELQLSNNGTPTKVLSSIISCPVKVEQLTAQNPVSRYTRDVQFSVATLLQEKTTTSNGNVTPDSDYVGLSKVTVNVNPTIATSWSGSVMTVSTTPGTHTHTLGFGGSYGAHSTELGLTQNGNATRSSATQISVPVKVIQQQGGGATTDRYTRSLTYTISSLLQAKTATANGDVTPDSAYIGLSNVTVNINPTLSASWTNSVMTVSTTPGTNKHTLGFGGSYGAHSTELGLTQNGNATRSSATQISVPVKVVEQRGGGATSDRYTRNLTYSISALLQEKTATGNGDVTPDSSYIGLSKVTVNVNPTLSATWNGSVMTVSTTPGSNTHTIGFGGSYGAHSTELGVTTNGSATRSSATQISVPVKVIQQQGGGSTTDRYTRSLTYSISSLLQTKTASANGDVTPDSAYVGLSKVTVNVVPTLSGAWSNGKFTVTASPAASAEFHRQLSQGTPTWSGNVATIPINALYGSTDQYSQSTGWSATLNVGGKLQTKTVTENGTYAPSSGYIGFSSVTVNVPGTSHSIDIPSAQIYTSDRATGTRLNVLKSKYEQAKADGDYVMFRVDCGGTTKWYYMEP